MHGSGDQSVPPDDARAAFEAAAQPKQFVLLETTNHVDLYDREDLVAAAVDTATAWLDQHLG